MIIYILLGIILTILILHTIVRIIRYFHKLPMPEFVANFIDNPLRRRTQLPAGNTRNVIHFMNSIRSGKMNQPN